MAAFFVSLENSIYLILQPCWAAFLKTLLQRTLTLVRWTALFWLNGNELRLARVLRRTFRNRPFRDFSWQT
jgi:hypothetical protein